MIHLALVVAAIIFLGFVALALLGIVARAFERGPGCGCLTLVIVLVGVLIVLAIAFA